jgi:hypothetical protein
MAIDENGEWFSGDAGRTDDEREFLDRLRQAAALWTNDAKQADTSTFAWEFGPLTVGVKVPKLTTTFNMLWVSYWVTDPARRVLEGAWGDNHIADDYEGDRDEDLTVAGVDAEPAQFATWCADWMNAQLKRPVVREEWGPSGQVAVWKLADTNRRRGVKGPWWKRTGPPTTVHRER